MELPCYILNTLQADKVKSYRGKFDARIEPRYIANGTHAGSYAIPDRIAEDEDWAAHSEDIGKLAWAVIDTDEAWPYVEEVEAPEPGLLAKVGSALASIFLTSDIEGQI
jgi:hypothetical protein